MADLGQSEFQLPTPTRFCPVVADSSEDRVRQLNATEELVVTDAGRVGAHVRLRDPASEGCWRTTSAGR
jgi:hypothetical protein